MAVSVKVCGLTRPEDVRTIFNYGADFGGLNLYAGSPRHVTLDKARELLELFPKKKSVAVDVLPELEKLKRFNQLGFNYVQIHFDLDTPLETIRQWREIIGEGRLWLAPKLPPAVEKLPHDLLDMADTFLVDAFKKDAYGGSGHIADWDRFKRWKKEHPQKNWILAGGLRPDNIKEAVVATGAEFVDFASGVESSPGIKDGEKIKAIFAGISQTGA